MTTPTKSRAPLDRSQRDASGYAVFSHGPAGAAHVAAHRALDSGRLVDGYRALLAFLRDRSLHDRDLVHLHWHLLVFESSLGLLEEAQRRLERHVLPAVAHGEAATDAPSALWRLRVLGSEPRSSAWLQCRAYARSALRGETSPFVLLHHLLALAGAGDHASLSAYNRARSTRQRRTALGAYALGLEALAAGDFSRAAAALEHAAPRLEQRCGGSRAQNELFSLVANYARCRAVDPVPASVAA